VKDHFAARGSTGVTVATAVDKQYAICETTL